MKKNGIAIVGCGTVGGSTALFLTKKRALIQEKCNNPVFLKYIIDKDFTRAKELGLDSSLFLSDLNVALNDPEIETIVELVGGITIAREICLKILKAKKNLVTANKALLAHHGTELIAEARKNGVVVAFEASCGGGIPIIRAIYDGLIANRIDAIYGIVNGTCNYILTEMVGKGMPYNEALADAQKQGFAEADPTLDVGGGDSAHKLAVLSSIAFGKKIDFDSISVQGIDSLELIDINYGQELGYVVKLLAAAERIGDGISLRVRPVFISKDHPLAWVSGPFNAISVYGNAVGHTMFYGRGAGGSPTASAIVSDIISVSLGINKRIFDELKIWPDKSDNALIISNHEIKSRYYFRITVMDKPGELARIATILGEHNISISAVIQKEPHNSNPDFVPIVITTHNVKEGDVSIALEKIDKLGSIGSKTICISIIEEPKETF